MTLSPPDPVYTYRKNMGQINCLYLSLGNGFEILYAGTSQGIVHVWDLETKREINCVKVGDSSCLAIEAFKDNILTQERGISLKFWKVINLEWHLVRTVNNIYHGFCRFSASNDVIYLPNDLPNGAVCAFKSDSEKELLICEKNNNRGEVMCIKCLTDRDAILVAYESGMLSFWEVGDNNFQIKSERQFNDTPMSLDYCESTNEGVIGFSGENLTKFILKNNEIVESHSTALTNPGVASIVISRDGKLAVAGCWDGRIRYFSMKRLTLLAALDNHVEGPVQSVIFLEDNASTFSVGTLFAAGSDGRISQWDLYTKRK